MLTNARQTALLWTLLLCAVCASAGAQGEDPLAEYLHEQAMVDLLEVHLGSRIDLARDDGAREDAVNALASFYLGQIKTLDRESPEHALLLARAWAFGSDHETEPTMELRLELLIHRYLAVEQTVELHQILLDNPDERARAIKELAELAQRLDRIEVLLHSESISLDRRARKIQSSDAEQETIDALLETRRKLSLTRYYIGWVGYSRAALEDTRVSDEAIKGFGWLLGAKGQMPTTKELERAVLEYEHVARASIGIALCKAMNGEMMTARAWIKHILSDESLPTTIAQQAAVRHMQIEVMDKQWSETESLIIGFHQQRSGPLTVPEARYIAIRVLEFSRGSSGGNPAADRVAQLAIGDLVQRGEIGHVLDLHRRYGSLPMLADRFLSRYANALMTLDEAESSSASAGGRVGYVTAESLFAKALKASDADEYPDERDDCVLKLAYCSIKGERPVEGLKACEALIADAPSGRIKEQAEWFRIIALEMLVGAGEQSRESVLAESVVGYIIAYPDSSNAARLLIRHGVAGTIDQSVAINALMQLPADDPAAITARRMLVQLYHQRFRASGGADRIAAADAIDAAEWLWDYSPEEPLDEQDARARFSIIRIVLDIASSSREVNREVIARAILRGILLTDSEPALEAGKDEILYRRIQFLLDTGDIERAERQIPMMTDQSSRFAVAAARAVLVRSISDWEKNPSDLASIERVIRYGNGILEASLPPPPEPVDGQTSAIMSAVVRAAEKKGRLGNDPASIDLAYRWCVVVLERGSPDEDTLRRIARLCEEQEDYRTATTAWLRVLATNLPSESAWYEARYESFRLMLIADRDRARQAMDQYRVLHPEPGPEPWGMRIEALVNPSPGEPVSSGGGDG